MAAPSPTQAALVALSFSAETVGRWRVALAVDAATLCCSNSGALMPAAGRSYSRRLFTASTTLPHHLPCCGDCGNVGFPMWGARPCKVKRHLLAHAFDLLPEGSATPGMTMATCHSTCCG